MFVVTSRCLLTRVRQEMFEQAQPGQLPGLQQAAITGRRCGRHCFRLADGKIIECWGDLNPSFVTP
jgi:hypothetical protein